MSKEINYRQLAEKRLETITKIRLAIKRQLPEGFPVLLDQLPLDEVLDSIFVQFRKFEKGRKAYRDELIRLGYKHSDLLELVEKAAPKPEITLGERFEFAERHTE